MPKKTTPKPVSKEGYTMPKEFMVFPSSGKPYASTRAKEKRLLAENKAKGAALFRAVDNHWKWLTESEPIKLTTELALEDFMSAIVSYLVNERKVSVADVVSVVVRQLEERQK